MNNIYKNIEEYHQNIVFDMIADMHNNKILNKILTDLNH